MVIAFSHELSYILKKLTMTCIFTPIRRSTKPERRAIVLPQQVTCLLRSGLISLSLIVLCICCFFFTPVKGLFIFLLQKSRLLKLVKFRTMVGYLKSVYLFR